MAHLSLGISPFPRVGATLSSLPLRRDAAGQKVEMANGHFWSLCFKAEWGKVDRGVPEMMYRLMCRRSRGQRAIISFTPCLDYNSPWTEK